MPGRRPTELSLPTPGSCRWMTTTRYRPCLSAEEIDHYPSSYRQRTEGCDHRENGAMSDKIEPLPDASLRDRVRTGIDTGIAALPYVGGPLEVLVEAVLVPSITKRREAWLRKL